MHMTSGCKTWVRKIICFPYFTNNSNAHNIRMQDMGMLFSFLTLRITLMHMTSGCRTWVCKKIICFAYFMNNSNAHDIRMQDMGM
jgi:hypothetical protein